MPKLFVLCCILLTTVGAGAAEPVSIQQLEQRLSRTAKRSDKQLASLLSNLELTERLSTPELDRMSRDLPGDRSRKALLAIADASAYLPPPASEIGADPAPDSKRQGEILTRAVGFVGQETERLPNFIATRSTNRFQDTKNIVHTNLPEYFTPGVFHYIDHNTAQVRYIGWKEAEEEQRWGTSHGPPNWTFEDPQSAATFRPSRMGLSTRGIFGPLLAGVMRDIIESKVGWSRWEQTEAGRVAVFRFAVAKNDSTYYVKYCCYDRPGGGMNEFETVPPYHGEIAIEPASGKVVRLAILADLEDDAPISQSGIVVEYGTVEIAGKTYVLPRKAISKTMAIAKHVVSYAQLDYSNLRQIDKFTVTAINDITFDHYQVFRGELKIVTEPMAEAPKD